MGSLSPITPNEQFYYNRIIVRKGTVLVYRGLTGCYRAIIQMVMMAKDDTKQVLWYLLVLLQTIILALSGWCLSYTVSTGERVARLEAKIDMLTNSPGFKVAVHSRSTTVASLTSSDIPTESIQ